MSIRDQMTDDRRPIEEDPGKPCGLKETVLMLTGGVIGLIALIGVLWFSRCLAHFLKTGGWSWL